MKTHFVLLLALLLPVCIFAQDAEQTKESSKGYEIEAHYEWSMPGHSITLNGIKNFGKHSVSVGIKYFDNWPILDNQHFAFKHRFRETASSFPLGLNLGYKYNFELGNKYVHPYVYFQSQLSYLTLMQEYFTNSPYAVSYIIEDGAYFIMDNTIGIGLQTRLYGNFYLNQSAGLGIAMINRKQAVNASPNIWEWSQQFRIGLSYHL